LSPPDPGGAPDVPNASGVPGLANIVAETIAARHAAERTPPATVVPMLDRDGQAMQDLPDPVAVQVLLDGPGAREGRAETPDPDRDDAGATKGPYRALAGLFVAASMGVRPGSFARKGRGLFFAPPVRKNEDDPDGPSRPAPSSRGPGADRGRTGQ
jgi:hypothetical protein